MTQTLNAFFKKAINSYYRHRAANETIKELSKLSNRELNDIGLARGDIWYMAHEDATRRFPEVEIKPAAMSNPNLRGFV